MKLSIRSFALACAILWGVGLFLATLWIVMVDGPSDQVTFIGRIYRGYSLTIRGSLLGLIWGLADGLICGTIFAWLYNRFSSASEG